MSDLAQLQAGFQAYLLGEPAGEAFAEWVVDDAKVGVKKRLGIYYDAYRLRIIEALAAAYPKLKLLLGDDLFETVALGYIRDYPSKYRNIRWYGDKMQQHLLASLPQHPVTAEMANFEWALASAFDAEDVTELQLQDLASIPAEHWADLSFSFQPALQMLPLRWNTVAIWKALDAEETPPALADTAADTLWLIWRSHLNPQFRSIDTTEAAAIQAAIAGATFAEICSFLESEMDAEAAMQRAAEYLADWIANGLLTAD